MPATATGSMSITGSGSRICVFLALLELYKKPLAIWFDIWQDRPA